MSGGSAAAGARRDALAGAILLVFGIAWTVTVYQTVPIGRFGVGPRAFPLYLGGALVVLSALLVLSGLLGLRRHRSGGGAGPRRAGGRRGGRRRRAPGPRRRPWLLARILLGVCGIIASTAT
jgi:hypothetical protein